MRRGRPIVGAHLELALLCGATAVIGATELLVLASELVLAAVLDALLIFAIFTYGAVAARLATSEVRGLPLALVGLAVVPLSQLLSLALAISTTDVVYQQAIVGAPLLAGLAWATIVARLPLLPLTSFSWPAQLLVALSGVPLGILAYALFPPRGDPSTNLASSLAIAASLFIFVGCLTELVYRGVVQYTSASVVGSRAPLISTVVFLASLADVRPYGYVVSIAVISPLFAWLVQRTGSVVGVAAAHGLLVVILFVVAPSVR